MKKYQSIKQIDLTQKSSPFNPHERKQSSKYNSCSRSAKRSLSKQQFDNAQCLTDRMNTKIKINQFQQTNKTNIKTYIRFKPITNNELLHEQDFAVIEQLDIQNSTTVIYDQNTHFNYDRVFQPQTLQKSMYDECAKELVQSFINGYNATIFAYGQTGSGKTYTMFGENQKKGIIPQSIDDIMNGIQTIKGNVQLSCSMLEIYRQNMIDLLTQEQKDLKIKQTNSGIQVSSLSIHSIKNRQDIMKLINKGTEMRKIRGTDVNQRSSRSHLIFTLYLQVKKNQFQFKKSKLNMVDLAGSQKVSKTKVSGQGLEQAKKINLSLSCLGNTINALSKGQDHIPFRDSKLTRVLQQSLSGNSLTSVIVTCSMHSSCQEQTYSSLKFAHRVKKIKTVPVQNIHQLRSSQQNVNRMMYQTLKSSFRNFEQKINQIKELLTSQGTNQTSTTKQQVLQMISMIINGADIVFTEGLQTDRSRKYQQYMERKLRTSQRKKDSYLTQSSDQYIKQLQNKVKDLQKIVIKQEDVIKNLNQEMKKQQRYKIKTRHEKNEREKTRTQANRLKVYKVGNQKRQTQTYQSNNKLNQILQTLKTFKNEKSSYEKMEKQILYRQIQDLMNRICSTQKQQQENNFNIWKHNINQQRQQYHKLQISLKELISKFQSNLEQNQKQFKQLREGRGLGNDITNLFLGSSKKSSYSLSKVSSTKKF